MTIYVEIPDEAVPAEVRRRAEEELLSAARMLGATSRPRIQWVDDLELAPRRYRNYAHVAGGVQRLHPKDGSRAGWILGREPWVLYVVVRQTITETLRTVVHEMKHCVEIERGQANDEAAAYRFERCVPIAAGDSQRLIPAYA